MITCTLLRNGRDLPRVKPNLVLYNSLPISFFRQLMLTTDNRSVIPRETGVMAEYFGNCVGKCIREIKEIGAVWGPKLQHLLRASALKHKSY